MRRLFLIRHAKAEPGVGRDDFERALTDRGREDAKRVASVLAAKNMLADVLIHSGAARARETAEIFAAQWAHEVALEEELGLYDATDAMLFARTRALPNSRVRIGFVGHNPGLGALASLLAGSGAHANSAAWRPSFRPAPRLRSISASGIGMTCSANLGSWRCF